MITPAYAPTATERVLPRLALDFTTGSLDPRVTVTRALNTATCVNSSGYIAGVNANLPRFDYNPTTLAPKGLLIEETRANLFLQSQTFGVSWTLASATISADAANGPDNLLTADKFIPNNGVAINTASILQDITKAASAITYTYSVFAKADGFDRLLVRAQDSGGNTNRADVIVNVSTGAIVSAAAATGTFTNASVKVDSFANGFFRVQLTFTTGTDTFLRNRFYALDSVATTGDGVKGVLLWGAQLEAGAFPTSYIPTTTTSLTRNADQVSMTGTNFSSWYNASEGAFVATYNTMVAAGAGTSKSLAMAGDGTANNRIFGYLSASNIPNYIVTAGGVSQVSVTNSAVSANTNSKSAFAYKENNFAFSTNGGTVATDTLGTIPTVSLLYIACFGSAQQLNGYMRSLYYYPQRLTNAELQAFSK